MDQSSEFLVGTILLDVVLLALLRFLQPPGDPRMYSLLAIVVVSPILSYLAVYQWDLGRSSGRPPESAE